MFNTLGHLLLLFSLPFLTLLCPEKKKTELYQELSLHARDLRFQHSISLTARNNCIILRMTVCCFFLFFWSPITLFHMEYCL